MARQPKPGTVYLIHLSAPIGGRAQHYIGWAKHLANRIAHHRKRSGARFLAVAVELNIDFEVVRTWTGDRQLERKLKNRKKARLLCPICRQTHTKPPQPRADQPPQSFHL